MGDPSIPKSITRNQTFAVKRCLALVSLSLCLPPVVLTILALGARWWWPLELCTHFRLHYFLALAGGAIVLGVIGWRKTAGLFAVLALWNGLPFATLYWPQAEGNRQAQAIRLLVTNVLRDNQDSKRFQTLIQESSPDVVLIMELTSQWKAATEFLDHAYPFHVSRPREDSFGIGLWCRHNPRRIEIVEIGPAEVPSVVAHFDGAEVGPLYIVGSHPLPPVDAEYSKLRNLQLAAAGKFVAQIREPVVLMGDLNTTSWSPYFQDLVAVSRLRDSRAGFGNQATWPSGLGPLGIAIDHVLVSPEIGVKMRAVGPQIGSDHRPVMVDIVLLASVP